MALGPITSQWLKIDLHCLQIVFHFWPKLTRPAVYYLFILVRHMMWTLLSEFDAF